MQNLLSNIKATKVFDSAAASLVGQDGDVIDMLGFEGVMFVLSLGTTVTSGATITLLAAQNTTSSVVGMAELDDEVTVTVGASDAEKLIILDLYQPAERYVRPEFEISDQTVEIDSIIAIQYGAKKMPVTQSTAANGVLASGTAVSPDEA